MKHKILLSASLVYFSLASFAQHSNSRAYAITGKPTNNFLWADIKQIDVNTGKVIRTWFDANKTAFITDGQQLKTTYAQRDNPTGFGVAACALDTRHNRLYFAPMHFSDIRFLDLSKSKANFTTISKNVIPFTAKYLPEESQLSRMVFAADGYGYALSNDAQHFIRFTTGRKPVVENLGSLTDAATNKEISVHSKITGWGGDMVADAFGKLVIISASHHIFSVDVSSKVATYTGTLSGLPANYTTNGAMVDDEGNMIVSSANVFDGLYRVDMKNFTTAKITGTENTYNASDLANGNFLLQKEADNIARFDLIKPSFNFDKQTAGRIYPNPVTNDEFRVFFNKQLPGRYTVIITDLSGKAIQTKLINLSKGSQGEAVRLAQKMPKGTFFVKVLNEKKQLTFSEKLIIL